MGITRGNWKSSFFISRSVWELGSLLVRGLNRVRELLEETFSKRTPNPRKTVAASSILSTPVPGPEFERA